MEQVIKYEVCECKNMTYVILEDEVSILVILKEFFTLVEAEEYIKCALNTEVSREYTIITKYVNT